MSIANLNIFWSGNLLLGFILYICIGYTSLSNLRALPGTFGVENSPGRTK